jgi:cholesterol transport system auxiliary component
MKSSGKRSPAAFWIVIFSLLVAGGCGATRPSKYYRLTVPAGQAPAVTTGAYPITLLVGPVRASHLYREDHIVYSTNGESMGTYEFQRWAEPPAEMIQEILVRELRSTGRYKNVDALRSNSRGDYVLIGRLFDLKEVSANPVVARIAIEMDLRDKATGSLIWSHSYAHNEPVAKKEVSEVVAALNRGVQQTVSEVQKDLEQFFATQRPQ